MTNEEIQDKANEIGTRIGANVIPMVFEVEGEQIIGYLQEPPRFVKLKMLDKSISSPISAASDILDAYLIREESDPRIYSEKPENDKYYIGATFVANKSVQMAVDQFKKK